MARTLYPTIVVEGDGLTRGRMYGALAKAQIENSVSSYKRMFLHWAGLDWERARVEAMKFVPAVERFDPEIMAEIRGIAEGAGVTVDEIMALNVRYEVVFSSAMFSECTSVAALPEVTQTGHLLMGQNWDWQPSASRSCIVLHIKQPGRPSIVTFVEAGIVAKVGLNSAGIGLCVNTLASSDFARHKVPVHAILRAILNARTLSEAIAVVLRAERASSCNYLVASKAGEAIDLEATSRDVYYLYPQNGAVAHANHFIYDQTAVKDLGKLSFPDSLIRSSRASRLLSLQRGKIDLSTLQSVFRDHVSWPDSICRHENESLPGQERLVTVGSILMDLTEMRMWLTDGPPCERDYREVELCFTHSTCACPAKRTSGCR